jgi:hypothetical protein
MRLAAVHETDYGKKPMFVYSVLALLALHIESF